MRRQKKKPTLKLHSQPRPPQINTRFKALDSLALDFASINRIFIDKIKNRNGKFRSNCYFIINSSDFVHVMNHSRHLQELHLGSLVVSPDQNNFHDLEGDKVSLLVSGNRVGVIRRSDGCSRSASESNDRSGRFIPNLSSQRLSLLQFHRCSRFGRFFTDFSGIADLNDWIRCNVGFGSSDLKIR